MNYTDREDQDLELRQDSSRQILDKKEDNDDVKINIDQIMINYKHEAINDSDIFNSDKEYEFLIVCMDLFMVIDEYCLKSLNIDQIGNLLN